MSQNLAPYNQSIYSLILQINGALNTSLCSQDMKLDVLRTTDVQKVIRNHVLHNTHYPGCKKGRTLLFLEYKTKVQFEPYHRIKRKIVTHCTGHYTRKTTQLEGFRFCNREAVMSRDAPHQQRSLNPSSIFHFLEVTNHMIQMISIQEKYARSFTKRERGSHSSTLKRLGTVRRGGGCDEECSSCLVERIRTERCSERENVGIAYKTPQNLKAINLIAPERQILFTIIDYTKFCHPHSRVRSLRGIITEC